MYPIPEYHKRLLKSIVSGNSVGLAYKLAIQRLGVIPQDKAPMKCSICGEDAYFYADWGTQFAVCGSECEEGCYPEEDE